VESEEGLEALALQWGRAMRGAEIYVAARTQRLHPKLQWGRAMRGAEIAASVTNGF